MSSKGETMGVWMFNLADNHDFISFEYLSKTDSESDILIRVYKTRFREACNNLTETDYWDKYTLLV